MFLEYYSKQKWVNPIRTSARGEWKLNWYDSGHQELYDLENDPNELRNLAAEPEFSSEKTKLESRLTAWRAPLDQIMNKTTALLVLFAAAILEAAGDALVRGGLHHAKPASRALLMAAGALVLFAYGYTVNMPNWDFGKLIGIYVVFFFVVAQLIGWLAFGQKPTNTLLLGGAFIIAGGFIISL